MFMHNWTVYDHGYMHLSIYYIPFSNCILLTYNIIDFTQVCIVYTTWYVTTADVGLYKKYVLSGTLMTS